MSVAFSAASQRYTLAGLSFSSSDFTMMCWIQRVTDRGTFSVPLTIHGAPTNAYIIFGTDVTGDLLYAEHNVVGTQDVDVAGPTLNNTDWFFVCIARTGTGTNSMKFYYAAYPAALTLAQVTVTSTFTITSVTVGDRVTNGEFFAGNVANVKVWSAALTQAEVELERWQYQPARTANLQVWYPFFTGGAVTDAQTDYSGNARSLSGGTSSTTASNPPVVWAPLRKSNWVAAIAAGPRAGSLGLLGVGR